MAVARKSKPTKRIAKTKVTDSIADHMVPSPHSVGFDQPLSVARALMRDYRVRHLPVLKRGRLVGIISQRDLFFLESIPGVDIHLDEVEEGMTRDVYAVAPETSLKAVAKEMAKRRYGSAVVMKGDRVAGIFTTTDALKLLAKLL